jgi:hypothetical protein
MQYAAVEPMGSPHSGHRGSAVFVPLTVRSPRSLFRPIVPIRADRVDMVLGVEEPLADEVVSSYCPLEGVGNGDGGLDLFSKLVGV